MSDPAPIRRRSTRHHQARTLQVITPVFGGGTSQNEAGKGSQFKEIDPVTPVRVPSIRGQLRYWWRATSGAWLDDLAAMKARETQIFGAASVPGDLALYLSDVQIRVGQNVEVFTLDSKKNSCNPKSGSDGLAYGAFSLSPQKADRNAGHFKPGTLTQLSGTFSLNWTCSSEFADEIRLAVHAWIAFGGIGGRTTRGFGQVGEDTQDDHVKEVLQQVRARGPARLGAQIPAIDPRAILRFKTGRSSDLDRALNTALDYLRKFRQGGGIGRNPGTSKRAGRSRWPEPDTIRIITHQNASNHKPNKDYRDVQKFPRAAFGMPIIFHFNDRSDPGDTTLQPVNRERMRSPLQVSVSKDGIVTYLIMTAPRPGRVELKESKQSHPVEHQLTEGDRATLEGRAPEVFTDTDPLRAFLKYVKNVEDKNITTRPEF